MRDTQSIHKWKNKCTQCSSVVYLETEIRLIEKNPLKTKRNRMSYTTKQLGILEEAFLKCEYVTKEERFLLSKRLNIGERNILIWFQNRRVKKRKSLDNLDNWSDADNASTPEIDTPIALPRFECFKRDQYELPFPHQYYEQGLVQTNVWNEELNGMFQPYNLYASTQPSPVQHEVPTNQHLCQDIPHPTPYFSNFFGTNTYDWMYD